MKISRIILTALLCALAPGLFATAVFTLDTGKALEKSSVKEDGGVYELAKDSRFRFAFDGEKLAERGTLFFAVEPDDSFGDDKSNPDILLQLGGNHWEPNNLTIFREKDGKLIVCFFGKTRVFQQHDYRALKKGEVNTFVVSWDENEVRFFLNGRRSAVRPSPGPIQFGRDRLTVGSPTVSKANWNFTGKVHALELDDTAIADAEIIKKMQDFMRPAAEVLSESTPYVKKEGNLVRIGGAKFELQVSTDGQPRALYDKVAGRFLISNWDSAGGVWWSFAGTDKGKESNINNKQLKADFAQEGNTAIWRYTVPENGTIFTAKVTPDADGTLRFYYALDNKFAQPVTKIYFPQLGGFEKGNDSWAFLPRWQGVRRDLKEDFKFMCWGGPGHLSMLLIALKLDDSTVMLYPQDTAGSVRFAIVDDRKTGPDGIAVMSWENRDWVQPGENFTGSADFVLANVGKGGLRAVADEYRKWAEKQPWFVTFGEKLEASPASTKILDGVIKMGGFESIGKNTGVYEPSIDEKNKECNLTYNYKRFLEVARNIENTYKVKPAYRYDGWWDRFDSRYPDYFPVNPRMGDFKAFMAENGKEDRLVYFHMNPVQYDFQSKLFAPGKLAMSPGGGYQDQVWSKNRLYVASPRPAMADQVAAVRQLREHGVAGIFEDVIGSTTMLDVNPAAGYRYPHRDSGTEALLDLAKALREASGDAFRGTEGGEERRLPYYDAFMMGSGNREEQVPFFSMVYGDCVVNATGIEGGGSGIKPLERVRNILFGMVLGLDGRHKWATSTYMPSAQMIFETQKLLKLNAGLRILDYHNNGKVYFSEWAEAFSLANVGKEPVASTVFTHETIGKVECFAATGESVVHVNNKGAFASWGVGKVELNGKLLFELKGNPEELAIVFDGKTLAAGNLTEQAVTVNLVLPGANFAGEVERRPSGKMEKINVAAPFNIAAGEVVFIR